MNRAHSIITWLRIPDAASLLGVNATPVVVLVYALLWYGAPTLHINLFIIPALALIFYLPGMHLTSLWPGLTKGWTGLGRFALSVVTSFALISTVELVLGGNRIIQHGYAALMVMVINVLMWIVHRLRDRWIDTATFSPAVKPNIGIYAYCLAAIMLTVILVTIAINPLAADADGFLSSFKHALDCQCITPGFRQMFVLYQVALQGMTGLSYLVIFRVLFPLLFFVSTLLPLDYIVRHYQSKTLQALFYLSLLTAPVVVSEINIIRPQVVLITFTIPILLLSLYAVQQRRVSYAFIALWLGLISLSYHELSIFLCTVAAIACVYNIMQLMRQGVIHWFHLVLAVVIVYPYTKLYSAELYFRQVLAQVDSIRLLFRGVHWRWWFINNYVSIDGFNIGWPGVQAVYYYAYSGLLLLLLGVALLVIMYVKRIKPGAAVWVPALYFVIFLLFAEFLPRIGFFFLPNRAWVHLVLGLYISLIIMGQNIQFDRLKPKRLLIAVGLISIVIGVGGLLYTENNSVSQIFREEYASIKFIRSTRHDSIFISSQGNQDLVEFYGGRTLSDVHFTHQVNKDQFDQALVEWQKESAKKIIFWPEISEKVQRFSDGTLISDITTIIQPRHTQIIEPKYQPGQPIFFIYSIRKTLGTSGTRPYLRLANDIANRDSYLTLGYPIVYNDGSVLVLKIK